MSRERLQPPQGGFCSSGSSPCASLALGSRELLLGGGRDWLQQQLLRISQLSVFIRLSNGDNVVSQKDAALPACFIYPGAARAGILQEFCWNSAGIAAVVSRGCFLGEVQLFPLPWK